MKKCAVKRPLLAALLSSSVAGLGRLYLRRWGRAFTRAAVFLGVGSLSGPDAVVMYLQGTGDFWSTVPLFVVTPLATLDACVVARIQNRASKWPESHDGWVCPNCRRIADPSLVFCQWRATKLGSVPGSGAGADVDVAEGGTQT